MGSGDLGGSRKTLVFMRKVLSLCKTDIWQREKRLCVIPQLS